MRVRPQAFVATDAKMLLPDHTAEAKRCSRALLRLYTCWETHGIGSEDVGHPPGR